MQFLIREGTLSVFLLLCGILNAQDPANHQEVCDSSVTASDIDLFTLRPISNVKKGSISICLKDLDVIGIRVREKGNESYFRVTEIRRSHMITTVDSINGVHKHKLQFDSLLIKDGIILLYRTFFTKDRRILRTDLYFLQVDSKGYCDIIFYDASNDINFLQYAVQFSTDDRYNFLKNYHTLEKQRVKLDIINGAYFFKGKSIYWHFRNNFIGLL